MNTLRALKKLIFGETWIVPAGVAATLTASGLIHPLSGLILLAGVLLVLVASVTRTARKR